MTREEEKYNQLVELFSAIDKQPKSIEVVLDKRQLNISVEANKRYLGRPPYQYYSIVDLARAFRDGAEYADTNPKSPWISVRDDLPCNHEELLKAKYETKQVFILKHGKYPDVDYMLNINGKWTWAIYKNSKFLDAYTKSAKRIVDREVKTKNW